MKRVLMKDIATKANVSLATVSYILNNVSNQSISPETRELVLKIAKELEYRPNLNARSLASKKSGLIGFFTVYDKTRDSPWKDFLYFKLMTKLEASLKKQGFHILYFSVDAKNPELDVIQQRELDGVIIVDVNKDIFYHISYHFNTPIVLVDSYLEDDLFIKVLPDYPSAIKKANALLEEKSSFLIADKANNEEVLRKIAGCSGLKKQDILFAENQKEVLYFLNRFQNKKGIIINEYLAMLAQPYVVPSDIAIICTCDCSELVAPAFHQVKFVQSRADAASGILVSLIEKKGTDKRESYHYISVM